LRDYGVDGQLGAEPTPELFIVRMVKLFREVRRVLRDDGTVWLNLGDSFYGSGKGFGHNWENSPKQKTNKGSLFSQNTRPPCLSKHDILKPKELVGIPWRVALALQRDGWYLRSDIVWEKPNAMPESVLDRPTRSHEYIFLLAKSERYYYDSEAVKEACRSNSTDVRRMKEGRQRKAGEKSVSNEDNLCKASIHSKIGKQIVGDGETRNRRSVWSVPTSMFRGAHFATFPEELIRPCVLAGAPKGGFVLDPFSGAGTTALVCQQEGRKCVGIELNPEFVEMSKTRLGIT
jgi:DNA modification methylase